MCLLGVTIMTAVYIIEMTVACVFITAYLEITNM